VAHGAEDQQDHRDAIFHNIKIACRVTSLLTPIPPPTMPSPSSPRKAPELAQQTETPVYAGATADRGAKSRYAAYRRSPISRWRWRKSPGWLDSTHQALRRAQVRMGGGPLLLDLVIDRLARL